MLLCTAAKKKFENSNSNLASGHQVVDDSMTKWIKLDICVVSGYVAVSEIVN